MAVIQNPLIGRARKSIGGVTFSTWRGLNVARTKPVSVNQKLTVAVIENRAKQSLVAKFVALMKMYLPLIYDFGIEKTTPFADMIRFLRSKLYDQYELDAQLLNRATIGTGNQTTTTFVFMSVNILEIRAQKIMTDINPLFEQNGTVLHVYLLDQNLKKIGYYFMPVFDNQDQYEFSVENKFISGDTVAIAYKLTNRIGGVNYSSKLTFQESQVFIEIA